MNRQSLTIDALKKLAREYLDFAKQHLQNTGSAEPVIILADPMEDGRPDEIVMLENPDNLNDDRAKDVLTDTIRQRIADGGFTAVLSLVDSYQLILKDPSLLPLYQQLRGMGMHSPEIAKMGVGTVEECINISVEVIDGQGFILTQPYTRDGGITFGDLREIDQPVISGRFKFFSAEVPA